MQSAWPRGPQHALHWLCHAMLRGDNACTCACHPGEALTMSATRYALMLEQPGLEHLRCSRPGVLPGCIPGQSAPAGMQHRMLFGMLRPYRGSCRHRWVRHRVRTRMPACLKMLPCGNECTCHRACRDASSAGARGQCARGCDHMQCTAAVPPATNPVGARTLH